MLISVTTLSATAKFLLIHYLLHDFCLLHSYSLIWYGSFQSFILNEQFTLMDNFDELAI